MGRALSIWATLPPGTRKRAKVCNQLIELRGRLDADCRLRLVEAPAYPAGTRIYASCEAYDVAGWLVVDEVVFDQFWDIATFPQLPADIDDRDQREVAVAYLVRGVFDAGQAQTRAEGGKP